MNWIAKITQATLASVVLLSVLAPPQALAQNDDPGWANVRVIEVRPDRQGDWITLQKEMSAAMKKAGQSREIWQVARGDVDTFHIITRTSNLGGNDNPGENPLGATRFASWGLQVAQCVGDRQVLTVRGLADLAIPAKDGHVPNLAVLALRTVIPGKRAEYEAYLKNDLIPAMKKAKMEGISVGRVFMGDSPNTYGIFGLVDKWSNFDGPHPIIKTLGEEAGRKVFMNGSVLTSSSENVLLRYRADLSIQP